MNCLLQVLRGHAGQQTIPQSDWEQTFRLAEIELVLPYMCAQLRRSGASLPEGVLQLLTRAEQEIAVANFWWISELRGILQAFSNAQLPVIPIKGPMFADRVYGAPHLRLSRDLDLLVKAEDLPMARQILSDLGFASPAVPDDYHQRWNRGTTRVELHHNVENPLAFRFDIAGAWQRATPREFLGQHVLQFSPADELLFICLHGVRHRFEQLSQVLDISLALRQLAPEISSGAYLKGPSAALRQVFLVGRAMAGRLDAACLTDPEILRIDPGPGTPRRAARLDAVCDDLWQWILEERGVRLNWEEQHRFYMDIEMGAAGRATRRIRHALILLTRLIQSDYDYAARYGIRASALVWLLRQCRLLGRLRPPSAKLRA